MMEGKLLWIKLFKMVTIFTISIIMLDKTDLKYKAIGFQQRFERMKIEKMGNWDDICEDLHPYHLNLTQDPEAFQQDFSPYTVEANDTSVELGSKLIVSIKSEKDLKFINYIMQARYMNVVCGQFEPGPDYIIIDCFGLKSNTIMHANNDVKTSVNVTFIAPNNMIGDISFFTSIIRDNATYWLLTKSIPTTVVIEHEKPTEPPKKSKKRKKKTFGKKDAADEVQPADDPTDNLQFGAAKVTPKKN